MDESLTAKQNVKMGLEIHPEIMNAETKTEVIIVGAGPTGLSLAAQLIRYGIDFIIIDSKEGVTELSKALVVHARSLEIYDQLGIAKDAVAAGEILQQVNLMHDGKVAAHLDFSSFGGRLSPFPFFLVFEQSKNERLLDEYLQQHDREVRWQTELLNITQDENSVTAIVKTSDGDTHTLAAKYLVGCDGASSPTRHLVGLEFGGSTHPRLFYVADVEMAFPVVAAVNAIFGFDAFALAFPMQGTNRWRLVGNLPEYKDDLDREVEFEQVAAKFTQLARVPLTITKLQWFSTYKVHTRHAETFSKGRCFLAGDAAHVHTPAGGQGMNTGIQDAYNLAWKLALVITGKAGTALLDSYNEERLANAKRLLKTTDRAFDFIAGEHWYTQFLRNHIFPGLASFITQFSAAKEFIFPTLSQIAINYRGSSLSQHPGEREFCVKVGDRLPYFLVNGVSIYDRLLAPKFHLIIFSNTESLDFQFDRTHADLIDTIALPLDREIVDIFGTDRAFMVLLRPDGYIGALSTHIEIEEITATIDRLLALN